MLRSDIDDHPYRTVEDKIKALKNAIGYMWKASAALEEQESHYSKMKLKNLAQRTRKEFMRILADIGQLKALLSDLQKLVP